MNYELKPTNFFLKQLDLLNKKSKEILKDKLILTKLNPSRNKKLKGCSENLFIIRFSDNKKAKRLIYTIKENQIKLLFILDRKNEYKELKQYLKKINL